MHVLSKKIIIKPDLHGVHVRKGETNSNKRTKDRKNNGLGKLNGIYKLGNVIIFEMDSNSLREYLIKNTICQNHSTLKRVMECPIFENQPGRTWSPFNVDTMAGLCHGGIRPQPDGLEI